MKLRLFFTLLLAVALCLYGCTKTEIVEIVVPGNPTEEPGADEPDDNTSGNNSSGDWDLEDDEYYSVSGEGTRENPYTVSQALEMLDSGTYDPDKGYYVKGVVARVTGGSWSVEGQYNIDYYISEDGIYAKVTSLFVDEGFGLGGGYFTSLEDLSEGDKVIVYGKLTIDVANNDRREMVHGKLYYWNGGFGDLDDDEYFMEYGDGSRENPYAVSQVFEITGNGTYDPDKGYYVKGIVSGLNGGMTEHYDGGWRITYYISEAGDGWAKTNLGVNYGYGLGGELFSSEDALSRLYQVVVYGRLSLSDYGYPIMVGGKLCYWNGESAEVDESF